MSFPASVTSSCPLGESAQSYQPVNLFDKFHSDSPWRTSTSVDFLATFCPANRFFGVIDADRNMTEESAEVPERAGLMAERRAAMVLLLKVERLQCANEIRINDG
mmetsp:Transcript_18669/g.26458  ORF Transcript_18669/g.26458 Transcript_18669/m.26458 type:complete len:105 (-) Transcript_18669:36-350(-)